MEYTHNAWLCAKILWISCKGKQRLGGSIEEQFQEYLSVPQNKAIEFVWQCEHHMVVLHGQQFLHPRFYPFLFFNATTVRTMPVSATMILILQVATFLLTALVQVIAKGGSSTSLQMLQHIICMGIPLCIGVVMPQQYLLHRDLRRGINAGIHGATVYD
jgi:hypothetical protein